MVCDWLFKYLHCIYTNHVPLYVLYYYIEHFIDVRMRILFFSPFHIDVFILVIIEIYTIITILFHHFKIPTNNIIKREVIIWVEFFFRGGGIKSIIDIRDQTDRVTFNYSNKFWLYDLARKNRNHDVKKGRTFWIVYNRCKARLIDFCGKKIDNYQFHNR